MFSGLTVPETVPVRRWTTVASFTLQVALLGAVLILPLVYPRSLPESLAARPIFRPTPYQPAVRPATQPGGRAGSVSHVAAIVVAQNPAFTFHHQDYDSNTAVPAYPVPGTGTGSGVLNSIFATNPQPVTLAVPPAARRVRTSIMMEGNLIHRIEPIYPLIAKQAGIRGTVMVRAVISRSGDIEQAQVVSGPALLGPAAVEAIRQWKYRPYVLNGEAIEVETQITVNFVMRR